MRKRACFCPTPRDVQLFSKNLLHYIFSSKECSRISFVSKNQKQVFRTVLSLFLKNNFRFPTNLSKKDFPKFYKHLNLMEEHWSMTVSGFLILPPVFTSMLLKFFKPLISVF